MHMVSKGVFDNDIQQEETQYCNASQKQRWCHFIRETQHLKSGCWLGLEKIRYRPSKDVHDLNTFCSVNEPAARESKQTLSFPDVDHEIFFKCDLFLFYSRILSVISWCWQHNLLTSSKRALFADEIAYLPKGKMGIFHCLETGENKTTAPRIIIEMQTTTIYADSREDYQR